MVVESCAADDPMWSAPAAASAGSCAVGSCMPSSIERLARLLAECKEEDLKRRLSEELSINDDSFASVLWNSYKICRRGCVLYPASEELAVSFNGGKDACVVLYIWYAAVVASQAATNKRPQAIFFDSSKEFPGIQAFVAWVARSLDLRMLRIEHRSFRQGMEDLTAKGVRAVVMGQRHCDPWMAGVNAFSPSSDGWPAFMRINPIIDWSYGHVWTFLRGFGLPYCTLYDEGYTSIGSVSDTMPNPALLRLDGSYAPAYELEDENLERAGRVSANGQKTNLATQDRGVQRAISSGVPKTAGIIVIGNEILNGKVHDANAKHTIEELYCRGVAVRCIEVVPDEVETIAASVRRVADACELVFTSGGLGPTHDDLTMAGVAAAFRRPLVEDARFLRMLRDHLGTGSAQAASLPTGDLASQCPSSESGDAAHRKMAQVPEGATVEWPADGNPWPLVSMRNVYIFAGMPRIFRLMFQRAAADGRFDGTHQWTYSVLELNADEVDIVRPLGEVVREFPKVSIGSYPSTDQREHPSPTDWHCRLSISFESFKEEQVRAARECLVAALPASMLPPKALEQARDTAR